MSFGGFEDLIGPRIPFTGQVGSFDFRLRRNVQWLWRSSKYIQGTFTEKDGTTEVSYELVTDMTWFILIRVIFTFPFLFSFFSTFSIIAFVIAGVAFIVIHLLDGWRARKLEESFLMEMNTLPHNYKSRFKK